MLSEGNNIIRKTALDCTPKGSINKMSISLGIIVFDYYEKSVPSIDTNGDL